jgi:hypothetical protein
MDSCLEKLYINYKGDDKLMEQQRLELDVLKEKNNKETLLFCTINVEDTFIEVILLEDQTLAM